MPKKYHVALSFAGEDRTYVEEVATALVTEGVDVFYDKFEEHDLWGKDLYVHLSDVYQNKAVFTVMFISEAYSKKVWTTHERRSAQARAFTESSEYILPAFFDRSVEVPGLLPTTGYIELSHRTPANMAALIVKKLESIGISLKPSFSYSADARADVDYPLRRGQGIDDLILAMKTNTWPKQHPAVVATLALDWSTVSADQAFVLGRNLYQCADGGENRAEDFLSSVRSELARIDPLERALDVLNGMFFEAYFDSSGELRKLDAKKKRNLGKLLKLQTVDKYSPSINYIQRTLEPYKDELPLVPSTKPELLLLSLVVNRSSPPVIVSLNHGKRGLIFEVTDNSLIDDSLWRLSFRQFNLEELEKALVAAWWLPDDLISIVATPALNSDFKFGLPDGFVISWNAPRD